MLDLNADTSRIPHSSQKYAVVTCGAMPRLVCFTRDLAFARQIARIDSMLGRPCRAVKIETARRIGAI